MTRLKVGDVVTCHLATTFPGAIDGQTGIVKAMGKGKNSLCIYWFASAKDYWTNIHRSSLDGRVHMTSSGNFFVKVDDHGHD